MKNVLHKSSKSDFDDIKKEYFEITKINQKSKNISNTLLTILKKNGIKSIDNNLNFLKIANLKNDKFVVKVLLKRLLKISEKKSYLYKKIERKLVNDKKTNEKMLLSKNIVYYCDKNNCNGYIVLPNYNCNKCSKQYCDKCLDVIEKKEEKKKIRIKERKK